MFMNVRLNALNIINTVRKKTKIEGKINKSDFKYNIIDKMYVEVHQGK